MGINQRNGTKFKRLYNANIIFREPLALWSRTESLLTQSLALARFLLWKGSSLLYGACFHHTNPHSNVDWILLTYNLPSSNSISVLFCRILYIELGMAAHDYTQQSGPAGAKSVSAILLTRNILSSLTSCLSNRSSFYLFVCETGFPLVAWLSWNLL